jgi:DNA repair exonuclease SbcCD ATPase subunit
MKPHKFEIYKNNQLIKQEAATKDYQNYLETQILKINHRTFVQILVLGSAVFTPFMQLPAGARRGVIEDLLDISVFSIMLRLLKEKIQKNKEETLIIDGKLDSAKKESVAQKRLIETLSTKNDDQLMTLGEELEKILSEMQKAKALRDTIRAHIDQLVIPDFIAETLEDLRVEYSTLKKSIQSDIKKSESIACIDHCPTCLQSVSDDHKVRIKSELKQK